MRRPPRTPRRAAADRRHPGPDHASPAGSARSPRWSIMVDPRRDARARPLAGVHDPRVRPGRPRVREPQPARSRSTACRRTGFLLAGRRSPSIAIQAAIPLVPPLAEAFRATPLDAVRLADRRARRPRPGGARRGRADRHRAALDRLSPPASPDGPGPPRTIGPAARPDRGYPPAGEPRDRSRHEALRRDARPRRA